MGQPSIQHHAAQGPGLYFLCRGAPGRCQGCCDSAVCGRKAQATAAAAEAGSSVERPGSTLWGQGRGDASVIRFESQSMVRPEVLLPIKLGSGPLKMDVD